jgi:hypothetical protein
MKVFSKKLIAIEIDSDDPEDAMKVAREVPMWEWDQDQVDETVPPYEVFGHEIEAKSLPGGESCCNAPHSEANSEVKNGAGEVDYQDAVQAIARTKKANWLTEVEANPERAADPSDFWKWLAIDLAGTLEDIEIELEKLGIEGVDLDEASIANHLDDESVLARLRQQLEEYRTQADFPGWIPEHGTSRYGYPLLTTMSQLADSEVREWARNAIDHKAEVHIAAQSGEVECDWVVDVIGWSCEVMEAVVGRLGEADAELLAYSADVFARADVEIAKIREEVASVPPAPPDLGIATPSSEVDGAFLDELEKME